MSDPASTTEHEGRDRGEAAAETSLGERVRDWLRGLLGGKSGDESLREDLEELLEEHADTKSPLDAEERLLLRNILKVGELRVDDIMIPRADIVAVPESVTLEQMVQVFMDAAHSRLPVYRENLDDVVGMVHIKDLLKYWGSSRKFAMARVVRKILFVPPSMPVLDLLLQMRATRVHMALVVDEYGGADGLVTIEDLVEQIVGEIHDEHDETEGPLLVERPDGTLEADARCPVEALENRLGMALLDEEREEYVDTLGGLVFALVGRIPQRGELIGHPCGIAFEVMDADPRRVKRLRVRNLEAVVRPTTGK